MDLTPADRQLIAALRHGLPIESRPYRALGATLGMSEEDVLERLGRLRQAGAISRLGVIVRHESLGFRANAMVVWDVPDAKVDALGERFGRLPFVGLCYRRPRRPPVWPYNLFTMIHGRDRETIEARVVDMAAESGIEELRHEALFTTHRFKQTAAYYGAAKDGGHG